MTEINRILSINTIDGLLKYEITVRTILIAGAISGLIALAIVLHFGGIRKTFDYFNSKLNWFFNTYVGKNEVSGSKRAESKIDKKSDNNVEENDIIDK